MVRASQVSRICTSKPYFDSNNFAKLKSKINEKTEKKLNYSFNGSDKQIVDLLTTTGFKTDVEAFKKELINKKLVEEDPLPSGAKTYLKEIWLENNYNFYDFSLKENDIALLKGNLMEDFCIEITSKFYGLNYTKNTKRINMGFLTGECDVHYQDVIRDNKCPETWKTFGKKDGIETSYKWQLVAYSLLYGAKELYLDYVLVENPPVIASILTKNMSENEVRRFYKMEESIKNLKPEERIKTYKYDGNLRKDQAFMVSRLKKAEQYYNSLTYKECMNMAA